MDTNKQAFEKYNLRINRAILQNPDFVTATASGEAKNSVLDMGNVEVSNAKFRKKVVGYAEFIDLGRGSGKPPPFRAIYNWLEFKKYGLRWTTDKERKSLAFAITKKIAKEGSAKSRGQVSKTEIFNKAVEDNLPKLLQDLVTIREVNTRSEILRAYGN